MTGDRDLALGAEDVDEDDLARPGRHADVDRVEAGELPSEDADAVAALEHAVAALEHAGRWCGWQTDDASVVHAGTQGLDLPIWDAGGDIAKPDDGENAKAGVDRQPSPLHDQGEDVGCEQRLHRFARLNFGEKYFDASRLEVFARPHLALRLSANAGPKRF